MLRGAAGPRQYLLTTFLLLLEEKTLILTILRIYENVQSTLIAFDGAASIHTGFHTVSDFEKY